MLTTILTAVLSSVFTSALLYLIMRRTTPNVQKILEDIGAEVSERFQEIPELLTVKFQELIEGPQLKKAMSILGKKSGDVRANTALRERVAQTAIDQIPGIGLVLDQFGITPLEGLKLINDPLLGPIIQRGIAMAQKGFGNAMGSNPQGQTSPTYHHSREQ